MVMEMESVQSEAQHMLPAESTSKTTIKGHVYAVRRFGALVFLLLRNRKGLMQVVVDRPDLVAQALELKAESVVAVTGKLVPQERQPQELELHAEGLELSSGSESTLPVEISRNKKMEGLSLNALIEYRPLTLRNQNVRAIFKIQAELCRAFREFLSSEEFTEIHTPKIVATGTEGGASLFEVNYFGRTAYLAQSPQFYKQIMVGVFERVFEIGPVYRAEEHSTSRHLNEYLSMDFEMGFIESEQTLMQMQTRLLKHMFASLAENCAAELALFQAHVPGFESIAQMRHSEAIELLQSKLGWKVEGEDLDPEAERLLCQYMQEKEGAQLLYLTHYPWSVRPFYALPEEGTRFSHSFDLLYKGLEITTGGQRIHNYEQLCGSIKSRRMEVEKFSDYLQCFKYGMPAHGGLAIGLERLCKQILDLKNVREASLFPRDRTRISP